MRWSATALLLLMIGHALAGEPAMTALSCDETFTDAYGQEHRRKVGLLVNLAEHTVSYDGMVAHIRDVTATNISFDETTIYETGGSFRVAGGLDRVTGAGWVYTILQVRPWTAPEETPPAIANPTDVPLCVRGRRPRKRPRPSPTPLTCPLCVRGRRLTRRRPSARSEALRQTTRWFAQRSLPCSDCVARWACFILSSPDALAAGSEKALER